MATIFFDKLEKPAYVIKTITINLIKALNILELKPLVYSCSDCILSKTCKERLSKSENIVRQDAVNFYHQKQYQDLLSFVFTTFILSPICQYFMFISMRTHLISPGVYIYDQK